jgi:cyclophilin family peptidyl-prolyl cis-trans isomerase
LIMNQPTRFLLFFALLFSVSCSSLLPQRGSRRDQLVTISTAHGDMKLVLHDQTPKHKQNFLKLAKEGFYNGTTFHRVIPDFMVQGGDVNSKDDDKTNDGSGSLGYTIPAEITPELKHRRGAVAAARMGDNVNPNRESSSSQFYIVHNPKGTPHLDMKYTVFGQVIAGEEVIDKLATQKRDARDRPLEDQRMTVKVERLPKKKITQRYGYEYR